MAIDWNLVAEEHVQRACEVVANRAQRRTEATGLVVLWGERRLPAKEVLREAYRLAKGLPAEASISFSSGEGTLNVLRRLGCRAERLSRPKISEPGP